MSTDAVAVLGFISLFALMLLRVPVGMAMGLVGVCGFSYLVGSTPALKMVGQVTMRTVTDYTFGVIPMFLLMGSFVSNSGMSRELFRAANAFLGHLRGGLGIALLVSSSIALGWKWTARGVALTCILVAVFMWLAFALFVTVFPLVFRAVGSPVALTPVKKAAAKTAVQALIYPFALLWLAGAAWRATLRRRGG